jgi:hypothetical protein
MPEFGLTQVPFGPAAQISPLAELEHDSSTMPVPLAVPLPLTSAQFPLTVR